MKKAELILHELDCPQCAAKIEHHVGKIAGVSEANVNFATKKLYVEMEDSPQLMDAIQERIHALEPEVRIEVVAHPHHHKAHNHEHCDHDQCDHDHDHESIAERTLDHAVKFQVKNLDCAHCAQKVESAVLKDENVADAALNFSSSLLFVKLYHSEDIDKLRQRLEQIADQTEEGVRIVSMDGVQPEAQENSNQKEIWRLGIALALFVFGEVFHEATYGFYLLLGALLVSGTPVILAALRNILHKEWFDENFLMSLAAIGAFAIGDWGEGCAVMIFYEIGELCQSFAVNRSRQSIASLMDIKAENATIIADGREIQVKPEEVQIGDIMQIRPGERVALDGTIIAGNGTADTSALTGESMPVEIGVGDTILAGSVNLNGLIQVRVDKAFGESTVSRILELVENAGSKKAPTEKFITKFSRIYTPTVVALALGYLLIAPLVTSNVTFEVFLYRALTFLVVSCPCALVVSVPLALFAGIGGASRKGILIKGGNYLEALSEVDTVVFDKTGTLTEGRFTVKEVHAQNQDHDALLELAAHGEAYSNHPIAVSIVNAYGKSIDSHRIDNFEEVAGNGIVVNIDQHRCYLGNEKFMQSQGITVSDFPGALGTVVHIAQEGVYLGYIVIHDQIKKTSPAAIKALKQAGVRQCIMLSGDRNEAALAVGRELGLDQVYAQLLPQDKVEKVEALLSQKKGGKLVFVGDGLNDAPVLARADIGVAMGGIGSDAAIEAADLVLMKDDPAALANALAIAKKTKRILWQNIIFALGIKTVVLILAAFGYSTMWMGVFADVGVTLLAVMNSMRALKVS